MGGYFPTLLATGSLSLLAWILSIGAAVALLYRSFVSDRRLCHIPGPSGAGFSKLWMIQATASGQMHLKLADACKKYGKCWQSVPARR